MPVCGRHRPSRRRRCADCELFFEDKLGELRMRRRGLRAKVVDACGTLSMLGLLALIIVLPMGVLLSSSTLTNIGAGLLWGAGGLAVTGRFLELRETSDALEGSKRRLRREFLKERPGQRLLPAAKDDASL
jgi:hypothetical protein